MAKSSSRGAESVCYFPSLGVSVAENISFLPAGFEMNLDRDYVYSENFIKLAGFIKRDEQHIMQNIMAKNK